MNKTRLALALPFALATLAGTAAPASAQTVRWAAAGDALTMDPHARNEGPTHVMNHQVYDSLVFRDQAMKLAPRLATSWRITEDPNVWEFKLREGVKYHDGNPFTADDVVFSILRAKHENSDMKGLLTSVVEVVKVDEHTVRMRTDGFSVTLSCPNDRYVNDEAICQAVTGMFGQIGVEARLDARPESIHFAELPKGELDLYLLGWGVPTMDSHYVFHYLYETRADKGGSWNVTGYSSVAPAENSPDAVAAL